jgi:hypothetical protein
MYAKKLVTSSFFCVVCFPYKEKIVTIYQLTYHDPKTKINPNKVVSSLDGSQ